MINGLGYTALVALMLRMDAQSAAQVAVVPQSRHSPIERLGVPNPGPKAPKASTPERAQTRDADLKAQQGEPLAERLALGLDVEVYHRFLWRGVYYSQTPVLQPSVWVRDRGFEASVWLNVMLGPEPGPSLSMVAPALGYQSVWAKGDSGVGLLLYLETALDVVPPTSGEAFLTFSLALGHGALRTSHYVHYLGAPGAYYGEMGPEYDREWGLWSAHGALILAWASDGYNSLYFDVPQAAVNALTLSLRVTRSFRDWLYISAQCEGTTLLHGPLSRVSNTYTATAGFTLGLRH